MRTLQRLIAILVAASMAGCTPEPTHPDPLPNPAEVQRLRGEMTTPPSAAAPTPDAAPTEDAAQPPATAP